MTFSLEILGIRSLGLTLLHSIWQLALISGLSAAVLGLLKKHSSSVRYAVLLSTLLAVIIVPAITFQFFLHGTSVSDAGVSVVDFALKSALGTGSDRALSRILNPIMPYIVLAWLCGVLFYTIRFTGAFAFVRHIRSRHVQPVQGCWSVRFKELCDLSGVRRSVQLLESAAVKIPIMLGFFKPVIIVPVSFLADLPPAQVEAILLHELAHIRRNDYLVNMLQIFTEIVFFYHPGIWWLSSVMRRERELCCDDRVIAVSKDSFNYAKALYHLGSLNVSSPALAMPASGQRNNLYQRIQRVLEGNMTTSLKTFKPVERLLLVCLLLAGIAGILSYTVATAEEGDEPMKKIIIKKIHVDGEAGEEVDVDAIIADALQGIDCSEDGENMKKIEVQMDDTGIVELKIDGQIIPLEDYDQYAEIIEEVNQRTENIDVDVLPRDGETIKKICIIKKIATENDENEPE